MQSYLQHYILHITDYEKTIENGLKINPLATTFIENQQTDDSTILNGRPYEQTGPPIVLFHSVFGIFINNIKNENLSIPVGHYAWTEDFLWESAKFHQDDHYGCEISGNSSQSF